MNYNSLSALIELIALETCNGQREKPCLDVVWRAFDHFIEDIGFVGAVYTQRPRANYDAVEKTDVFHSSLDKNWLSQYFTNDYNLVDPVVRCMEMSSPVFMPQASWDECTAACLSQPRGKTVAERKAYLQAVESFNADAKEHGLRGGVYMVDEINGEVITLSIASGTGLKTPPADLWRGLKTAMMITTRLLGDTNGCAACGRKTLQVKLTAMEITYLTAILDNPALSLKDIAQKYNKSINTINTHLLKVRQKLDMPRAKAAALAQFCRNKNLF